MACFTEASLLEAETAASYRQSWPEPCLSCPCGSLRTPSSRGPHPFAGRSDPLVAGICPRPGRSDPHPSLHGRRRTILAAVLFFLAPARALPVRARAFPLLVHALPARARASPVLCLAPPECLAANLRTACELL